MAYGKSTDGWKTEMTTLLRYVINDADETAREFTDERLCSLLVSSAHLTLGVVDFPANYTVDIPNSGISPTPTNDKSFVNLVVLKAACLLAKGEYRSSTNHAIVVRDGPSTVDPRGMVAAKKEMMDMACANYEQAELEYRLGNSNVGEAIIGPHRNAIYGGAGRTDYQNTRNRH